jgi:protein-L-isoaspartate(D-aspartate) O-methyltransferase
MSCRGHFVSKASQSKMKARDIHDPRVLAALRKVPRHQFVPRALQSQAYADRALPIEHGQTISQPYMVALMTQLALPGSKDRALDVGTGSGYQAAVLAELVEKVYSIEILRPLAESAGTRLEKLGYRNVQVRCGDGYRGWPERAPFDVILVAAAPDHIPQPLIDQLAPGGRLVIPVGDFRQELIVVKKDAMGQVSRHKIVPVAFVPMTGEARQAKGREGPDNGR